MAYVYRHIRLDKNEPFYIGIGSDSVYKRARERTRRNEIWMRIVAKTNYDIEILFDDVSWEYAKAKEIEFIALYGRKDNGTGVLSNMSDGGDGELNKVFTEEYRKKLSDAAKRRKEPQPQLQKIIQWRRDNRYFFTDETRAKIRAAHLGKKKTEKHKDALKKSKTGDKNPMFSGYIYTFKNGTFVGRFGGATACSEYFNLNYNTVSSAATNRHKTKDGYYFHRVRCIK